MIRRPLLAPRLKLLAAVALCLVACSSKQPGGGDITVYTCNTDADCASIEFVCDPQRLECVCVSDTMCASKSATPYCNVFTGQCVATHTGCTATSCATGQFCNDSVRECQTLTPYCGSCTSNAQCGANNECVVHPEFPSTPSFCAAACGANQACPTGQTCSSVTAGGNQCVPTGQLCNGTQTCTPDALTPCESTADCNSSAQVCNTSLMVCVAATNMCLPGQACDPRSMTCVLACQTDNDCVERYGQGFECLESSCVPQGECTADTQCPTSQFCLFPAGATSGVGQCSPTCQMNSDCPIGQLCHMQSSTGRNACVPGCASNSDCLVDEICSSGMCISGCQTTDACPFDYVCSSNACVKAQGQCATCDNGCASGAYCARVGFCCDTASCPSTTGVSCVAGSGIGCGTGQNYCYYNRCLLPCVTATDCAHGFTCEEIADTNGSSLGDFCQPVNDGQQCLTPP